MISQKKCHSKLLKEYYTLQHEGLEYGVIEACGGCKTCRDRNDRDKTWFSKIPIYPREVWKIGGVNDSFKKYFSNDEGYHIEWDEDIFGGKNLRHLKETFKIFWENEVHKSIIVGETNPLAGHAVESGGLDHGIAVGTRVSVALVVRNA